MNGPNLRARQRQRGVALITILLITTLAAAIVMTMLSRHHLSIEKTRQVVLGEQALAYAEAGEAFAAARLMADFADRDTDRPLVDSLVEPWAKPFEPLDIPDGEITVEVHDLQARFNLNNVGADFVQPEEAPAEDATGNRARTAPANSIPGAAGRANIAGSNAYDAPLGRLLELVDVDADLAGVIKDWVDADNELSSPFGAEDSDYLLAEPPHRAANAPMVDSTELLAMREMHPRDFLALREHVTALPALAAVNVNTAGPVVLRALGGNVISEARATSAAESERDFDRVAAFFEQEMPDMLGKEALFTVYSSFFEAEVKVRLHGRRAYLRSLLYRNPNDGSVQVLARSLIPPEQLSMVPDTRR